MLVDLYILISRINVNLTISYDSEFLIKNDNDVICIFSIHQRIEVYTYLLKKNVEDPIPFVVIFSWWYAGKVQVGGQIERQVGGGSKVKGDVEGQVGEEVREREEVEGDIGYLVGEEVERREKLRRMLEGKLEEGKLARKMMFLNCLKKFIIF